MSLNNTVKAIFESRKEQEIKQTLRLGVLSDTRPVRGHIWPEMLNELIEDQKADLVVNGGDFTDWSRKWEYKEYLEKIKEHQFKMLHVIGNHDDRFFGNSYFKKHFGSWDFFIDYGNWRLIFLRNTWKTGYGTHRYQRDWLRSICSKAKKTNKKICFFTHVPVFTLFQEMIVDHYEPEKDVSKKMIRDDELHKIIKDYCSICVFGHAHMFAISRTRNTGDHVISGGGAPNLYPCKRINQSPYEYCQENNTGPELTSFSTIQGKAWSVNHSLMIELNQDHTHTISLVRRGGDIHPDYVFKRNKQGFIM